MPMTMSRTLSPDVKWRSCAVSKMSRMKWITGAGLEYTLAPGIDA